MSTDKKITELPAAASINASDVSVLVNSSTDYQYTFTLLLQFLQSNLSTGANISFGAVLPQNSSGKNGDVFVNTSAGSFAQKISGAWTIVYTLPAANAADGALLYGAGMPGSGTGKNSDSYINTLTGIFYKKSAGTWSQVFSMATGPQGPQGTAGTNGIDGTDGNTILFGTSNPSNTLTGVEGNFYINTTNYTLFGPKTAGVWEDGISLLAPGLPNGGSAGQVLAKIGGTDYETEWRDNSFANLSGAPADNEDLAAALDAKQNDLGFIPENTTQKNGANGYAGLDGSGKVAATQLPSYVDDVLEFASFAALPATGESGKIYVTLDTNAEYRWSGSAYIQIVASPGSTDAVAEGTTNLYFTVARVLTTLLTGIGLSSATAVTATDTILGAIGKLQAQITGLFKIPAGGAAGQVLAKVDGTDGNVGWVTATGGSGSPGGTTGQIQINDSGSFSANDKLSFDPTNGLIVTGPNYHTIKLDSPNYTAIALYSNGTQFASIGRGGDSGAGPTDLSIVTSFVGGGDIRFYGNVRFVSGSVYLPGSGNLGDPSNSYHISYGGKFFQFDGPDDQFQINWATNLEADSWQNPGDMIFRGPNIGFCDNTGPRTQASIYAQFMKSSKSLIINGGSEAGFTAESSALLQLDNTGRGFLPPRMTSIQKDAISSPAEGLQIYDTTLHKICFYNGSAWETLISA